MAKTITVAANVSEEDERFALEILSGCRTVPRLAVREAGPHTSRIVRLGDLSLTPVDWLIRKVLPANSLVALVADPASYKSFVALSMAGAVITGMAWAGRGVQRGGVLYLAAEGAGGMKRRARAWELVHGGSLMDMAILPAPSDFLDLAAVEALEADIAAMDAHPALIVVDTLARNMRGDENKQQDMGGFVDACDRLRVLTGACVLIVHHNNKSGGMRGSTALPAGIDTAIELKRNGASVTLTCSKQKEGEEFPPIHLAARVMELGIVDEEGEPSTSIAMQPASAEHAAAARKAANATRPPTATETKALDALACLGEATASQWERAASLAPATFHRARKSLTDGGRVCRNGEGQGGVYAVARNHYPDANDSGFASDDNENGASIATIKPLSSTTTSPATEPLSHSHPPFRDESVIVVADSGSADDDDRWPPF